MACCWYLSMFEFQSTLPMRGATARITIMRVPSAPISIHAPHAGSDGGHVVAEADDCHFNPRSPCGERHGLSDAGLIIDEISIHAPHAGSDRYILYFNDSYTATY